jgi:hypothetical protein
MVTGGNPKRVLQPSILSPSAAIYTCLQPAAQLRIQSSIFLPPYFCHLIWTWPEISPSRVSPNPGKYRQIPQRCR